MADAVRTVGRYDVVKEIGRGGMAIVYLARQSDLDRYVALKELAAFHQSNPNFSRRFVRESRLIASLSHPNIVTVHDYFEHGGVPYIAMEYLERGSLRPYVNELTVAQTTGVLEGLLAGLTHAETRGVVHRDLKPENLMLTSDGRVKIADFGIAKATSGMATNAMLTATGMTVGTPTYMAPEQAMAQEIGPWTDLYSVGCMAYEMLCGRPPFPEGDAPMAILLRHINEPPPPPRALNGSLDPRLSEWIERLLVKDPHARTATAAEAWDELEEIVINTVGPRWRREARLADRSLTTDTPRPLTPAPFDSTHTRTPTPGSQPSAPEPPPAEDEFESFHLHGAPPASTPAQAPSAEEPAVEPTEQTAPDEAPSEARSGTDPGPRPAESPLVEPPTEAEASPDPPAQPVSAAEEAPEPQPPSRAAGEPAVESPRRSGFLTFGRSARPEPVEQAPPQAPVAPAADAESAERPVPTPVSEPHQPVAATVAPTRPPSSPPPAAAAARLAEPSPSPTGVRRGRVALLLGGVGLAAIVGFIVAPSKTQKQPESPPALSRAASSPALSLKHPSDFRAAKAPAAFGLADSVAIARTGHPGEIIAAGRTTATGPTLLSSGLRSLLTGSPAPVRVRLGALEALRYADLRRSGIPRSLGVFAVPTSSGVVNVVCAAPAGPREPFASDCERIAQTLTLRGAARGFPVGPSASYAAALGRTAKALGARRRAALAALGRARTPAQQASAARAAAAAYAGAADALGRLGLSPYDAGVNRALVTSLAGARRTYADMAAAAAAHDRARYDASRRAVAGAEKAVVAAFAELKTLGYNISG